MTKHMFWAASLAAIVTGTAQAQTAAEAAPDEIVVTARRTAEKLSDVPISVSALTAEQLAATGARGLEDVARQTPGFSFERTTGTLAQPVIRGQAQSRLTNPVQNVATFFNGIYLQRPYQVDSELLDLERVEVIKGPQSALYGRNAFAGAISYVTKKPDLESLKLSVDATIGTHERRELKGSVSVPLAKGMAALSLAASTSEFDGTWRNNNALAAGLAGDAVRTKGRLNGYDNQGFLAQLRVKPSDVVEFNAFWNRRDIFVESPANYQQSSIGLIGAFNVMNCTPFEAPAQARLGTNALYCGALPASPILATGEPRSPGLVADVRTFGQDSRTNVAGATLDVTPSDAVTLTYQFGHADADALGIGTLSRDPQRGVGIPGPFAGRVLFDSRGNGEIESDSHELRANYETASVRLLAGGYAAKVKDFDYGSSYAALPGAAPLSNTLFPAGDLFPPGFSATSRNERVRAVFGSAGLTLAEAFRVTVEARQTWERITQQAATFPARTLIGAQFSREFKYFTPRLTLDYKPGDDTLLYVSAARGVKSGGFNPAATLAAEQVFDPEKNWTYEAGVKTSVADGAIDLTAAVFHVDWSNLQVNRAQTGGTIGTPLIIGNVSGANVNGVEASAVWRPAEGLSLNAGISYSDAQFKNGAIDPVIPRALCQNPATLPVGAPACSYNGNIGGNTVPRAPALQANIGIGYRADIGKAFGSDLALVTRADVAHQGRLYTDNTNTAFAPSRTIVDASIGVDGGAWSLKAFVRNLFDQKYVSYAFATFAGSGAGSGVTYSPLLGDRRSGGVTLSFRY